MTGSAGFFLTSPELRDIREEIRAHGTAYACQAIRQERIAARREVCQALHLPLGETVYRGSILNRENGSPAQLEERFIVEAFAAGFLDEDLRERSLYAFLRARSAPSEIEHVLKAGHPDARTAGLLELNEGEPILTIRRRTWAGETVAVLTRFTYPGDRYFVVDRHRISSQSRLGGGDLK